MVQNKIRRRVAQIRLAGAILAAGLATPATADVPSYAQSTTLSTEETIHGRVASVDGAFLLSVDDDRGFVDRVRLRPETIVHPLGLVFAPQMSVTITGVNAGATFDADEIDTPYSYDGTLPEPVFYGAGYWCPGFAYGYGPSFGLAIVFGGAQPWAYANRPFYGRPWNGTGYFGAAVGVARGHVAQNLPATSGRRAPTDHVAGTNRSGKPTKTETFSDLRSEPAPDVVDRASRAGDAPHAAEPPQAVAPRPAAPHAAAPHAAAPHVAGHVH